MQKLKTILCTIIVLTNLTCKAMKEEPNDLKTISDLGTWCYTTAKKLNQQPQFEGTIVQKSKAKFLTPSFKALPFDDYTDARIFEIIHNNAHIFYTETGYWKIRAYNEQHYKNLMTIEGLTNGLLLFLDKSQEHYPLEMLKVNYESIIGRLQKKWLAVNAYKYPTSLFKDPQEWSLFIKEQEDIEFEDTLINFLAKKLNLRHSIRCFYLNNGILHNSSKKAKNGTLLLWVKKDQLPKIVNEVFKLEYLENESTC